MTGAGMLLLAGMNCDHDMWTGTGLERGAAVAIDRPDMSEQIRVTAEMIEEPAVLVGSSLGAIVAMALAVERPELVRALVLTSTNAQAPTDAQYASWQRWRELLAAGSTPAALQRSILPSLVGAGEGSAAERAVAMGERTSRYRLDAQLRLQATRRDLLPELAQTTVPTLVIAPRDDALCPLAFHRGIAEVMPRASLVEVAGHHLMPIEAPEEFGRLVSGWLSAS